MPSSTTSPSSGAAGSISGAAHPVRVSPPTKRPPSTFNPTVNYITGLEQSFVTSLHLARNLVPKYSAMLDVQDFFDLNAQKAFRTLILGRPLASLPFTAHALSKSELDAAMQEIQEASFMRKMQTWGSQVIRQAEAQNTQLLNEVLSSPPRMNKARELLDSKQLMAHVLLNQLSGATGHQFGSVQLRPLGLKLNANSITVLAGRSAAGKSALAEQVLLDLCLQGAFCIDVTVEQNASYRGQRYLQHIGGPDLAPDRFTEGTFDPVKMARAMTEFTDPSDITGHRTPRHLWLTETCFTLKDIEDTLHTYLANYEEYVQARKSLGLVHPGPPVVMIDYIQLIKVKSDGIYDKMNEIIETLYELTKKHGLATILLSQLKRNVGVDPKTGEYVPDMTHLEGSGRIEQLAHNILFVYAPQAAWSKNGWKKVICAAVKRRGSEAQTLEGLYNGSWLTFTFDPADIATKL